jgi:ABC-type glutathione transport system ATPase component
VSTASVLQAEGLRKVFGSAGHEFIAVDDVSFTVPAGGALAIVGESGSGKTTVARMLAGLERPSAGRIVVAGRERTGHARLKERRRRGRELQIVFQDPYSSLDRRQRIGAAITAVLRLHHSISASDARTRMLALLDSVGLDERHAGALPVGLSGGQRQRVAIAIALAADPQVLVLDESVAALDVSIQAQILNLLADIRERTGIAYVLISHDLAVVRQVTEEAIVMQRGKVVERGPTADVLTNPQEEYTQQLIACIPRPGWRPSRRLEAGAA